MAGRCPAIGVDAERRAGAVLAHDRLEYGAQVEHRDRALARALGELGDRRLDRVRRPLDHEQRRAVIGVHARGEAVEQ